MKNRLLITSFCCFLIGLVNVNAQCNLNPVIMPNNLILCPDSVDTLYTTEAYDTYQWFKYGKPIPGATKRYLVVHTYEDAGALFKVQVTRGNCVDTSSRVLVDGYAFASPIIITNGTPSYFDVRTQTSVFCKYDSVSLTFGNPYDTDIQWYNSGQPIAGANSQTYKVTNNGAYTVCGSPAVCPDFTACESIPVNIAIDKFTAEIKRSGDTLLASKGKKYQWNINGNEIPGATAQYYFPVKKGLYTVTVMDQYNCLSTSKPVVYIPNKNIIAVSPNPAKDVITIRMALNDAAQILISDVYGSQRMQVAATGNNQRIAISHLHTGTYVLRVLDKTGNVIATERFMKN